MRLVGLTGGIGMGKSTAAGLLRQRQIPLIDTDDIARAVVEPGQPALQEIAETFGTHVLGTDGRLRRDELAKLVFADPAARVRLEAILHPRIRQIWQQQAEQWRAEGCRLGVVVIPLLYETGAETSFDTVVCVACSAASQQQRLTARGWSAEQIHGRLVAQWPVARKMDRAQFVIWTEGVVEVHAAQLDRLLARIR